MGPKTLYPFYLGFLPSGGLMIFLRQPEPNLGLPASHKISVILRNYLLAKSAIFKSDEIISPINRFYAGGGPRLQ